MHLGATTQATTLVAGKRRAIVTCVDCGETGPKVGRGLCRSCYKRHHRRGTLGYFEETPRDYESVASAIRDEWPHMIACYGGDARAASQRLAQAYGVEVEYVRKVRQREGTSGK